MQLGIIGLSQCGKATLFSALTGGQEVVKKGEVVIGTIDVPDPRVDVLSDMYKPKKTTYAKIQYMASPRAAGLEPAKAAEAMVNHVKTADALIHVVRNFADLSGQGPAPAEDYKALQGELIFSDLVVAEKRLERLEMDAKRGRKPDETEIELLRRAVELLNNDTPLRTDPEIAAAKELRGFTFVSAKPELIVFNNPDEEEAIPDTGGLCPPERSLAIRARLEQEIAQMDPEEAADFLAEFNLSEPAMNRMIRKSYELLGQISFFTVGEDEVRAWTVRKNAPAVEAAGAIHTDLEKGFIRAEVLAYDDLMSAGSYNEARKTGTVRLEGKTYEVQDGDILHVRFNV